METAMVRQAIADGNYRPLPAVCDDYVIVRSTGSGANWFGLKRGKEVEKQKNQ